MTEYDLIIKRTCEERDHFLEALIMIEELSTDEWAQTIATTALKVIRETPSAPAWT